MNTKKMGLMFAIISAISWGTYGTFYSLLLERGISDLTLVVLAPLTILVFYGIKVLFKPHVLKEIPIKYYIGMLLQGLIIVNCMNYCYSQAYASGMAVGIVSVVNFTNIIVVMIESYFLMKYKFTISKIVSMVVALLGISLVLEVFSGGQGVFTAAGLMWTILIPVFYGTNVTLNAYFIAKECDSDAILLITHLGAVVFMFLFQLSPVEMFGNIASVVVEYKSAILLLLGFCALPEVVCFGTMQESLKRIEPSIYGICFSLDPVTSFILGIIVFAQPIAIMQIIGVVLIIAAVAYINHAEGKEAKAEAVQ